MHNPLRSETDVFRAVLVVGAGAAAVIAVTEIAGQTAGAIVLAVLAVVGAAVLWQRSRGELPRRAEVTPSSDDVYRILVVANETVGGRALLDEIRNRSRRRRSEILVVVPALTASQLEHWASDVDGAIADAQRRLEESLATMRSAGLDVRGHVGDHHEPNASIEDALREFPADELIISTHPPERSRWLEQGVVERARREVPLPVTHVVVDLQAEAGRIAASRTS
jgi:hypothetical protein